ncbi:MAG: HD-GYP domain-containing protein [Oscillospiraceae bacterium]
MLAQNFKGTDIDTIIKALPSEQVEHMAHVGILAGILSEELCSCGLCSEKADKDENKYFCKAIFYHDIGKVSVPCEILSKPGGLTDEELHIIQRHTLFADKLFIQIRDGLISGMPVHLIPLAHDSAVYHHEWWNGNGYPYGISHENIPLIARVTSICDAYDAITNDRIYRKAHSHNYACCEIEKNAGIQFDPSLVKIFLDHEDEFSKK